MDERKENTGAPLSDAEKSGLAKKKAINKAASYFSDDDSLFEFEGFEVDTVDSSVAEKTAVKDNNDAVEKAEAEAKAEASERSEVRENSATEEKTESDENDVTEKEALSEGSSNVTEETAIEESTPKAEAEQKEEKITEQESLTDAFNSDDASSEDSYTLAEGTEKDTKSESDDEFVYADEEDDEIGWPTVYSSVNVSDERSRTDGKADTGEDKPPKENTPPSHVQKTENTASDEYAVKNERQASRFNDTLLTYSLEHTSVSAEGQIHFDGTEPDFLADRSGASVTDERNEEIENDLFDESDLDNEIWDRAGKEEWERKESFIERCRALTLPQINTSGFTPSEPENKKAKPTSSGYRYAESERIPVVSDGLNGGTDKAGYAERERRYCEDRKAKREIHLREKSRSLQRTVLYTALILLTTFLLELLNTAVDGKVVLFGSIEIGLILLSAAFVFGAIYDGLKCAARGTFIPEIMTFITVVLSLTYMCVTVFTPTESGSGVLIGLPAVTAVFLTAVYQSLMARREKKVFDITADYGYYCTEVRLSSFRGSPEEVAFGGYAGDGSALYRTNRIVRADRGYNVQPVRDECFGLIKILFICTVCAAIAAGIAFGFIRRDVSYGLFCAYALTAFTCPLSLFISLALPRHLIAQDIAEDGAAITEFDEESDELDENVIMLSEEELFPPENIRIIDAHWKNSHFLESHLSKAAAAFNKAGGLLSGLFSEIDLPEASYRETVITDVSDGGITVKVDDSLVRAGTDAYLEKHGIEIERYPDIPGKDTRVLYIANNGEFFSRIVIKFVPDAELCERISELRQSDTLFSLKTSNPCIDSALIFYTTGLEPELLRVVKYMIGDSSFRSDTDREGTLISRTGAAGLLSALLGYKKQKKLVTLGTRLAGISGLLGLALALTVSLIGIKWAFISFAVLGFHALLSALSVAFCLGTRRKGRR